MTGGEMRILLVVTNVSKTKAHGLDTGFHFAEFSHAYEFFVDHGYDVVVGSPSGGPCTITSDHPGDRINETFKHDSTRMSVIEHTQRLADIKDAAFDAIYMAGGHGTMFDFANNESLAELISATYSHGGIIASVCHGPAGLIGVRSRNGKFLVDGVRLTSFTNDEEKATDFFDDMPFMLQTELTNQGARYEHSKPRVPHLAIGSRIITGQNPESIELVIGAVHALLTE
jgi:putative intracellular protease/amidase